MHIALIGMSNIGKTHWADRLVAEHGFVKIDCDLMVEQRLGPELQQHGYAGIQEVAKWMGQPYAPQYPDTSQKFIECERDTMQNVIAQLRATPIEKTYVVDTTGSVIYQDNKILEEMRSLARVVYFEASPAHRQELFKRYMEEPKPVVWGDAFSRNPGENDLQALERCYPLLLESRARRYEKLTHVTIPFTQHRKSGFDMKILLSLTGP